MEKQELAGLVLNEGCQAMCLPLYWGQDGDGRGIAM